MSNFIGLFLKESLFDAFIFASISEWVIIIHCATFVYKTLNIETSQLKRALDEFIGG